MRGAVEVGVDTAQDAAVEAARAIAAVAKQLEGKEIKKVIFVPGERQRNSGGQWEPGSSLWFGAAVRWVVGGNSGMSPGVRSVHVRPTSATCVANRGSRPHSPTNLPCPPCCRQDPEPHCARQVTPLNHSSAPAA